MIEALILNKGSINDPNVLIIILFSGGVTLCLLGFKERRRFIDH